MCVRYTPVDATADSCVVEYTLTIDGCEYSGSVPVLDVITDPCANTVDSDVYIDVRAFIKRFGGLGIRDEDLETATYGISDSIASNPGAYKTVSFSAAICCSGISTTPVQISDWDVVFSSISTENGYVVNDYFYTLDELVLGSVSPKVLAVPGSPQTNTICLSAGDTNDSSFYSWVWLPIPSTAAPLDWTASMTLTAAGLGGFSQTVNVTQAKRGVLGVDIGTVIAGIMQFSSGNPLTSGNILVEWELTDNVGGSTYTLGSWDGYWDTTCCNCQMFQFMNEFGVYDYMSLGKEKGRTFTRTSTQYNVCPTCRGGERRKRFGSARSTTSHILYTRPFTPSEANLNRMRSFFESTEIFWPDRNKYVYLEPDLNVTIERSSGKIQIPVVVTEVSDKPLLINRR